MKAKPKQSKQFRAAEVRRFLTACADGRVDDVKKYLAEGHDANNHDDLLGDRPLHRAAQNGQVRVARILLANGADIEARVGYGGSERPLDSASDRGYLAMVRFLISKGAKINASGTSSALIAAARHGHLRVIDFLLQKGASQEPDTLYWAVRSGNVKATKALIQSGANVKSVADDNCVSRAAACLVSGAEMLKLLAQHGVDLQTRNTEDGTTLLHHAGNEETAIFLIKSGADVRRADLSGETPLHHCAGRGFLLACRLLIEMGADPRAKTKKGFSPRQFAKMRGRVDVFKLLTDAL